MSKKKSTKEVSLAQQALELQQTVDQKNAATMQGTTAGAIWDEIKDRDIEMFALPNQKVNMHCHPVTIEPSKLYLLTNSSAVLPSLELAIGRNYVVELVDKFVIVSRAIIPVTKR
jgi:hypothetical protein